MSRINFLKVVGVVLLTAVSACVAWIVCTEISERYFFDRLIYNKSRKFGYVRCLETGCNFEEFGRRFRDIKHYVNRYSTEDSSAILGTSKEADSLTVAVFGDSYVWGVGVKEDETVAVLLEKKLPDALGIRVTVLQLGLSGDSAVDNLAKYDLLLKRGGADLYVFVVVENDLLVNQYQPYGGFNYESLLQQCEAEGRIVFNSDSNLPGYDYHTLLTSSYSTAGNTCIWREVVARLPVENAIIFLADDHMSQDDRSKMEYLESTAKVRGLQVVSSGKGKFMEKYNHYFLDNGKKFVVSQKESHPSKIAHEMFADILVEAIKEKLKL